MLLSSSETASEEWIAPQFSFCVFVIDLNIPSFSHSVIFSVLSPLYFYYFQDYYSESFYQEQNSGFTEQDEAESSTLFNDEAVSNVSVRSLQLSETRFNSNKPSRLSHTRALVSSPVGGVINSTDV